MIELLLIMYDLKEHYLTLYALTLNREYLSFLIYLQNSIDIIEKMIDTDLMNDYNLN